MPSPDRKPPAPMESRDPKSIRFNPTEWAALSEAARQRGLDPSSFVRDLSMTMLMIVSTPGLMEAHLRALAVLRGNGHSISA